MNYWMQLLPNRGKRPLPKAFKSWVAKEIADVNATANFPKVYLYGFKFICSGLWDQRFLNLFILWIILLIIYLDGFAALYAPMLITLNAGNQILMLPPLLMFVTQVIPFLGTLYFATHCNDLVQYLAVKNIGSWVS